MIDCTFGRGGHAAATLAKIGQNGHLFAFDRDQAAIEYGQTEFHDGIKEGRLTLIAGPFSNLKAQFKDHGSRFDAIYADVGVSSPQFDDAERGFSLKNDGPLDMRMDQSQTLTAATIVNEYTEAELTRIFEQFGEEPKARIVARKICERRMNCPFERTLDLADFIKSVIFYKTKSKVHPATRCFQALRIEVNSELDELRQLVTDALDLLKPGGRLAIISFHSLEDRIVKTEFNRLCGRNKEIDPMMRHLPVIKEEKFPAKIIKPYPVKPKEIEIQFNPRARSARLRIIEKNESEV